MTEDDERQARGEQFLCELAARNRPNYVGTIAFALWFALLIGAMIVLALQ